MTDRRTASEVSTSPRAAVLVARYVPIVRWLPGYRRSDLGPDAVAGLTSWALMVPVALAYASVAGVPSEYGLITAFAALAAYAIFGTSRQLKVTTSSTMAIMSFSLVAPLAGGDGGQFIALSAALALIVGVILLVAGALRLGFIADFLAKPVVTGFIIGVAISIIVGQLPKLLGVDGVSGSVVDQLRGLVAELPQTDPLTLAVGLLSLAAMWLVRRFIPRLPAGLVTVILGITLVKAFGLDARGVAVVGAVPTGLHGVGLPDVGLSDLTYLLTGALGLVFLVVGESLSAARTLALRHRQEVDADQELLALGAANATVGLFSGFVVDASLSQSAASDEAGARTQVSSLITSALVLLTVLFLAPLFADLPMATLAVVVIVSAAGLIDVGEVRRYWAWRRTDGLLAVAALVGVATTDVLAGLVIAVLLSLLMLLFRASRPYIAELGSLPGDHVAYADITRHAQAAPVPDMLLIRLDAPLYFFNASVARTQVIGLVDGRSPSPAVVVMDLGATADLDVTTTDMLSQLLTELDERGVALAIAQARGSLRDRLQHTGLLGRIGPEHLHVSMAQAVANERLAMASPATRDEPAGRGRVDDPAGGQVA